MITVPPDTRVPSDTRVPADTLAARPAAHADLREKILAAVGAKGLVAEPAALSPYLVEARGLYGGQAPFAVLPGSTEEVAATVRLCAEAGVAIVPQGGNTGLVGGGLPCGRGDEIVLGLSRMNRVRDLDPANDTMTVEAGCVLRNLQETAAAADRLFPLSLGAEGTCQIGGNISTNAGGVQVLRYGNTRDLVLGLEVVLPDGRIWNGLRRLRKDNTGYDLKQLFIGAEGTLGIVTAAVLKLFPLPKDNATAFAALRDLPAAIELLTLARGRAGQAVTSFELLPRIALDFALRHVRGIADPLAEPHDWYALVELSGGGRDGTQAAAMEALLAEAFEAGLVRDAALAASAGQSQAFWRLREAIVEAQKFEGGSIKHDISVPISRVPAFLDEVLPAVEAMIPGIRPIPFGHVGDGNIHLNFAQPIGADREAFLAQWDAVNRLVHDAVMAFDGSISAEHGLGRMKVAENQRLKDPVEIALMQALKATVDPRNLMNPGKVVPR